MKCRGCGNDLAKGALFCEYCGARVYIETVNVIPKEITAEPYFSTDNSSDYEEEADNDTESYSEELNNENVAIDYQTDSYQTVDFRTDNSQTVKQGSWKAASGNNSSDSTKSAIQRINEHNAENRNKIMLGLLIYALIMILFTLGDSEAMSVSGNLTMIWLGVAPLILFWMGVGAGRNILLTLCGLLSTLCANHFLFGKYNRGTAELFVCVLLFVADQFLAKHNEKYRTEF